jgi:hypothetical protein
VTGYVLILHNAVATLHLERLRIIRGESLYQEKYGLYVAMNYFNDSANGFGLRQLGLVSLRGLNSLLLALSFIIIHYTLDIRMNRIQAYTSG